MEILGIDIGGSGIKGAPVDTVTGQLLAPRQRLATPVPSKPKAVADTVAELVKLFDWHSAVGCGFPAVVQDGVVKTAANISQRWIGTNAVELFSQKTECPVVVLNDADAAGLAEMTFGAGKDRRGTVLVVTIGTGLGTALFVDGYLVPNLELGHVEIRGKDAELRASDAARKLKRMSWNKWAERFDEYLLTLERLLWPNLIILGGGVIKEHEKFLPLLTVKAQILPAQFMNEAGIVGAALAARRLAINPPPSGGEVGN